MEIPGAESASLAVEVFAAKDSAGALMGLMMAVPCRCGLNRADSLRIDGHTVMAMREQTILPIDFAALTDEVRSNLTALAQSGQRLAVAEFTALGMLDAYFLNVVVVR